VTEPLVYTVPELQAALKIGRRRAYELAREVGVRISPRRIVIPRVRVEELLNGKRGRE
jgi:tRNA U55 pseudouridine synthase TruB